MLAAGQYILIVTLGESRIGGGVFMSSSQNTQSEHPVTEVDAGVNRVSCDGGGGALGHPRIWLTMTAEANEAQASVVCPYCSRQFIRRNG